MAQGGSEGCREDASSLTFVSSNWSSEAAFFTTAASADAAKAQAPPFAAAAAATASLATASLAATIGAAKSDQSAGQVVSTGPPAIVQ
mmetsp:Transcript_38883/g.82634  ORF Transcript_38883/g.82634 Transcript_38883/m.82634 type:complete len:88 (+) Transcript_38883:280-543(+)